MNGAPGSALCGDSAADPQPAPLPRLVAATRIKTNVMVRQYLQQRLAELPADPRSGGNVYYQGLLDIYEDIVGRGHPEPLNALTVAMGVPKETVKTRLRVARQRQAND